MKKILLAFILIIIAVGIFVVVRRAEAPTDMNDLGNTSDVDGVVDEPLLSLSLSEAHQIDVISEVTMANPEGYEIHDVEDTLEIQQRDKKTIEFRFNLIQSNAHLCTMGETEDGSVLQATYEADKDAYVFYESEPDWYDCELRIHINDQQVRLEDVENQCRLAYCGARAGIDGTVFVR